LLKFEPISRSDDGLVDILQIGRRDDAGYFYYVMELADDSNAGGGTRNAQEIQAGRDVPIAPRRGSGQPTLSASRASFRAPDARGPLPPAECVSIGLRLASALEHLLQLARGAAALGALITLKARPGVLLNSKWNPCDRLLA